MKIFENDNGYQIVGLHCKKLKKSIRVRVHRIVGHVFIPNVDPKNKTQVNHIDKNRENNYYKNLEWTTPQENIAHSHGKMVKMLDPDTNDVLKVFRTVKDAERYLDLSKRGNSNIGDVCNGTIHKRGHKFNKCAGYKWKWVKPNEK